MSAVRLKINPAFWPNVLTSQQLGNQLLPMATRVLARARSTAPVDSGAYQGSLYAVVGVQAGRVKARVVSTDPAARIVEKRHHTLANALGAAR